MKKSIILSVICIIIITAIIIIVYNNNKIFINVGNELNDGFILVHKYYDYGVYTSFDSLTIKIKNKEYSLEELLRKNEININDLINYKTGEQKLNDGGTIIYRYDNLSYSNKNFLLVKCNTIDGNKDIYIIGNYDYTNGVCRNN